MWLRRASMNYGPLSSPASLLTSKPLTCSPPHTLTYHTQSILNFLEGPDLASSSQLLPLPETHTTPPHTQPFHLATFILPLGHNSGGTSYRKKLFLAFQGWDDAHQLCPPGIAMAQIAAHVTLRDSCMVSCLLSSLDLSVLTIVSPAFSTVPGAD